MNHNVESTRSTSRGRFSHWLQTVTYYTSHVRILRRTTYSKGIQRVIRRELRTSLVRIDAIKRNGSNYESMVGTLGIFLFFVGRVQHWESIRRRGIVTNSKVQIFSAWNLERAKLSLVWARENDPAVSFSYRSVCEERFSRRRSSSLLFSLEFFFFSVVSLQGNTSLWNYGW